MGNRRPEGPSASGRPRRPEDQTASHDQSAVDGDQKRRSGEGIGGLRIASAACRAAAPGMGAIRRIGCGCLAGRVRRRTCHEESTYDRDEPVRDVRRTPAECRVLPGVRPFLLLVGLLHAAPRAARGAIRAAGVLPGRLPSRRAAGPAGRAGGRRVIARSIDGRGRPFAEMSASRNLAGKIRAGGPGIGRGETLSI